MSFQRPIAVDLFAGAGGMSLGFESAGFDVFASVEIDPIHCLTHKYNFPQWAIFCQDIRNMTDIKIRTGSAIGQGEIDVVFGGPPCQGFSLMGKRDLYDPRNQQIGHFADLVIALCPKYFVMENVLGMAISRHRKLLDAIINRFSKNGYQSQEYILNANRFGIPQSRERFFLIGHRGDLPSILPPTIQLPINVGEALRDLPRAEEFEELYDQDWIDLPKDAYGKPSDYAGRLRGIIPDAEDYSYPRLYPDHRLTSSRLTRHSETSIARFQRTPPGKIEKVSRFYKLDPDGFCNTLRAGTPDDQGGHTAPRPIHYDSPRCITVREGARLHSYPDWFRFHVTKWHGFRQVGNSVPPLLARAIAREIIKALKIDPIKPKTAIALGNFTWLEVDNGRAMETTKSFK
jgi:DNA (cytosine-5)-methyltransferase 1